MANYNCVVRTNYFRVKDKDAFRDLIKRSYGSEENLELFEREEGGKTLFGFGCYGSIAGLRSETDENDPGDENYDDFIDELQRLVADDDAVIIMEAGWEKLRYIVGQAEIVTGDSYRVVNIQDVAAVNASRMLDNPNWRTRCEY